MFNIFMLLSFQVEHVGCHHMHFTNSIAYNSSRIGFIYQNAVQNRYVLSNPLNLSRLLVFLMLVGSLFHSVSAACLKDLAANVVCLTVGILSMTPMLLDLMFSLFCSLTEISSCGYLGAKLLMHL